MLNEIRKIWVFLKRDFLLISTYKLAFLMTVLTLLFNFLYMVLFGAIFQSGGSEIATIQTYGGNYIAYLLIGSVGWGFIWTIMTGTSISLRTEMQIGTLESILSTPTSIFTMIVGYTLFSCFFGLLSIIILSVAGFFLFGISAFGGATIYTLVIFILSTMMMMGLGMILSGLTIWIKNIGDTTVLLQNIAMFFCGVYFPLSVLPAYLQPVAKVVPFYYSIEGLRLSMLPGTPSSVL